MMIKQRCAWAKKPLDIEYHDTEWGVPVHDDHKLFEFLILDKYIWSLDGNTIINSWKEMKDIPVTTKESDAMSRDLKKRGFKFVGSTICYAFMQAAGLVNDHVVSCYRYNDV